MNLLHRQSSKATIENLKIDMLTKVLKTQPSHSQAEIIPLSSCRNVIIQSSVKREDVSPFQTLNSSVTVHKRLKSTKQKQSYDLKHQHSQSVDKIKSDENTHQRRQRQVQTTIQQQRYNTTLQSQMKRNFNEISQRFHKIQFLGKGKFSDVFMAVDQITHQIVAIKLIQKSIIKQFNLYKLLTQEIKILHNINHPNIMRLYGVLNDKKEVALILEYCQSSLYKLQAKISELNEDKKLQMIYEMLRAFSYLHDLNIIHRDIKPENIMIIQNRIKVGDFGLAMKLEPKEKLKELCGTRQYMAPEVSLGQTYDLKADCYSLGLIIEEFKCHNLEISNMVSLLKQNDSKLRGNIKDYLQLKAFQKVKQILSSSQF